MQISSKVLDDLKSFASTIDMQKKDLSKELEKKQSCLDKLPESRCFIHKRKELMIDIQKLKDKLLSFESGKELNRRCKHTSKFLQVNSRRPKSSNKCQIYSGQVNPCSLTTPNVQAVNYSKNPDMMLDEYEQTQQTPSSSVYILPFLKCSNCGINLDKVIDSSMMACPECGRVTKYLDSSSKSLGYNDEIEFVGCNYRRQNHFREWLNSFQGRENTVIPDETIQSIMKCLIQMGVRETSKITRKNVREALKTLKLRKYYDNITSIICKITDQKPVRFPPELEERLELLFSRIQRPFNKYCPASRKNFLSYSDIIYKLLEIEGETKYLPFFRLLKGQEKRYKFDLIWKPICKELGLPFYPSV